MLEKALAEKEKDGTAFAASVGAASLAELRAKPAADVLAAVMAKNGGWGYSPGVDGHFLPERAAALYAKGRQAKIPLLAGWTSSEIGMAVAMNPQKPTVASFTEELKKTFGEAKAPAAARDYGATADEARRRQAAAALASDLFIAYSTWKWIEVHAALGRPSIRYRFDRALPAPNGMNRFGAVHASDIEYAFHTLDSKTDAWTPEDRSAEATFSRRVRELREDRHPGRAGRARVARVRQDAPRDDDRREEQPRARSGPRALRAAGRGRAPLAPRFYNRARVRRSPRARNPPWPRGFRVGPSLAVALPVAPFRRSRTGRSGRAAGSRHMDLLVTLIIGGVVGWLASILMKTDGQMGLLANIIVGIIGSFVGFALAGAMNIGADGAIGRWIISIAGASLLIALLSVLGVFRRTATR